MPHLIVQYSSNLAQRANLKTFCNQMRLCLLNLNLFPEAGIRVRAVAHDAYSIADNHQENAFLDMILRIGEGRTDAQKTDSGETLLRESKLFFKQELARGHFMISVSIIEMDAKFSWKYNPVHDRLRNEGF